MVQSFLASKLASHEDARLGYILEAEKASIVYLQPAAYRVNFAPLPSVKTKVDFRPPAKPDLRSS